MGKERNRDANRQSVRTLKSILNGDGSLTLKLTPAYIYFDVLYTLGTRFTA